jgi:23S rRNA (guanosine2251-2'-O)-methyltransferase
MLKEELKFIDSCVFEGMTSIRAILRSVDEKISDRRIEKILFDKEKLKKISKEIGYLRAVSEKYGFFVEESNAESIAEHTIGNSHGGIVALCSDRSIPCLTSDTPLPDRGFFVMIQGIEDPYNFGYSLRSLYACGCDGIILPERNWMSAAGVVARSSAGASERFPMYTADALVAAECFKARGYTVVCADEKTDCILGKCDLKLPILLIVGGEKRGISGALMQMADIVVKIPYARDFAASLSAASATTMLAYEIARQNF